MTAAIILGTIFILDWISDAGSEKGPGHTVGAPEVGAVKSTGPAPEDLEREEAVAQRVIDFMATNEDTPQNLQRVETLFAAAQCERVSSGGTMTGTKRAAVGIAGQAPEGMVGVFARLTWGTFKGMFLVAHFDLDCAPEYALGG